jgi:putative restriction endonuclease
MSKNNWSREELMLAFNLYCKIPFTKINARYKPVIELSKIIDRTPDAVAFKLANFARLDPALQKRNVGGLKHGSKGEELIWNEFHGNWEELSYQSEKLLAEYKGESVERTAEIETYDLPKEGKERDAIVKVRVNQNFFRSMILSSYQTTCCITGLKIKELLVGSHIIPWSTDKENRMNPENGLCLNALHDKAFDKGLITISADLKVIVSDRLLKDAENKVLQKYFFPYHEKEILKPDRFMPKEEFLQYHRDKIFKN